MQGYSNVSVDIDSAGNVTDASISGYGIFRKNIEEAAKKVKWLPEIFKRKSKAATVLLKVQFQLKPRQDMPKKRVIVIESEMGSGK